MFGVGRATTIYTKLLDLFRLTCVLTTLSMVLFWIHKYNLNLDLCRVDFRYYHQSEQDVFPFVSLCFMNPFSRDRLMNYDTNVSSYISYLEGKSINKGLQGIPYDNVTMDLDQYVKKLYVQHTNGTYYYRKRKEGEKLLVNSYDGFWFDWLYKCYAVNVPHEKHIQGFGMKFDIDDFENGFERYGYKFFTLLHYPNQLLLSASSAKYDWIQRPDNSTYSMRFKIEGMEVLNKRNKNNDQCKDNWKNYDADVLKEHVSKMICRAPYHKLSDNFPLCSTNENLQQARDFSLNNMELMYPCKIAEKISFTYEEGDSKGTDWAGVNEFWISLYFYNRRYKEITQTREIDMQALIGNVGGYIGLCLGYTILQIPEYLQAIFQRYKERILPY